MQCSVKNLSEDIIAPYFSERTVVHLKSHGVLCACVVGRGLCT